MYIFLSGIVAILAIIWDLFPRIIQNKNAKLFTFIIVTFFFVLFVGYRDCGFDYDNYRYYYKWFNDAWLNNSEVFGVEKGYAFLNHILPSFRAVFLVMALFTISLQLFFLYKYSPAPFASLLFYIGVFLYASAMGQYRQSLALAIVIWAFVNYEHKIKFLVLIALACLFHMSALIALLILFMPKHICKLKTYIILFALALVINLTAGSLFMSWFGNLTPFIADKLETYSIEEAGMNVGFNRTMLLRIIIFVLFYINRKVISQYKFGDLFFNLYFVSILMYMGFGFLPQLAGRGSIYFSYMELILAGILVCIPRKGIMYFGFFLLICVWRQISFFNAWSQDFIPYKNELFSIFDLL